MNKQILFFIVSCLVMGFAQSRAMESCSAKVLSLKNLATMQIAQESDVERLKAHISALHLDLALQVLVNALSFNLEIYPVAKCDLLADFRKREGLSVALVAHLEHLERKLLLGGSMNMDIDKDNGE